MKKVVEKVSRFLSRENVDKYYDLKRELGAGNFSIVKMGVNRKTASSISYWHNMTHFFHSSTILEFSDNPFQGEEVAIKIIDKKRVGQKKVCSTTGRDLSLVSNPSLRICFKPKWTSCRKCDIRTLSSWRRCSRLQPIFTWLWKCMLYFIPSIYYNNCLFSVTGGELFDRIVDRGSFSEKDACRILTVLNS